MKNLPDNKELMEVAKRVVWFQEPEDTLKNSNQFALHVMQYGTLQDVSIFQKYFTQGDIENILKDADAGILDKKSWHYWHTVTGNFTPPPMPVRVIDDNKIPPETLAHIRQLEAQFSTIE